MKLGLMAIFVFLVEPNNGSLPSMDTSVQAEAYDMLLFRANERKKHYNFRHSRKYTTEHNELVDDVVRTFNGLKSTSRQYEVLKGLISDLGIAEMTRGSFNQRACAIRKQIGVTQRATRRSTVGPEISAILKVLFENNPEISVKEICKGLVLKLRGMEAPPELTGILRDNIRSWLQYRKYDRRYQGYMEPKEERAEVETRKRERCSCCSDDELFWKDVSSALADPLHATEEAQTDISLSLNDQDVSELWKELNGGQDNVMMSDNFFDVHAFNCGASEGAPDCAEAEGAGRESKKRKIQEIL